MDNCSSEQPDNTTTGQSVPKQDWYKNKRFIAAFATLILLIAASSLIVLLDNKNKPAPPIQKSPTNHQPNLAAPNRLITIPDITFKAPAKWVTFTEEYYADQPVLKIHSPDVTSSSPFEQVATGTQITINHGARDKQLEANFDSPIDAYTKSVGSPRINDVSLEFDKQSIDWSKYYRFTNANGVNMISYPWAYEGCSLIVLFLSDTQTFTISITQPQCPTTQLLTNDPTISQFINSIELQPGDNQITVDVAIRRYIDKPGNTTVVSTKEITFSYDSIYKDRNLMPFSDNDGILVPKLDEQGNFSALHIGQSTETFRSYWQSCNSPCFFTAQAYGTVITFRNEPLNNTGLTKLADSIYGSSEELIPIQKNATSYLYHYKTTYNGTFDVSFAIEIIESEQSPFIKLADEHLIDTIKSVQLAY